MSTLARANANARRVSMAPPGGLSAAMGGGAGAAAVKKLSVDSTSFDEWMKMATDNKINPTNTFSIALIDYFHDMSLLRSDSGDGSINFQKASCTLDGCVKVWTSRVDSVVTETGRLLNGLVGDGKDAAGDEAGDLSGEVELDEDGNAIGIKGKKDKKKRSKAREATLVKNFSAIAVKKLDLETTADPLFKKTSEDFDEGGAGGLLMNHLAVDDKMRIVFDAGDAPGVPQEEEDVAGEDGDAEEERRTPAPSDTVDLTRLQAKLFSLAPSTLLKESFDPLADLLQGRLLCPSLSRFSFAPDQEAVLFGQEYQDSDDEEYSAAVNPAITATPWGGNDDPANAFAFGAALGATDDEDDGDFDVGNDSGADLFGVPAELDRDAEVFGLPPEGRNPHSQGAGDGDEMDFFDGGGDAPDFEDDNSDQRHAQWDPRHGPSQHDLLLAFKGVSGNNDGGNVDDEGAEGAGSNGGLFDYFDQRLMKSWAGPEHWKMKSRLAGFAGINNHLGGAAQGEGVDGGGEGQAGKKKARAPKEAFVIDFTSEEGAVSVKDLFDAPRSSATTLLPKSKTSPEQYLLPEDRHFTSRNLLRLFSKPRAVLNIRTRRGALRLGGPTVPGFGGRQPQDEEVSPDYWAQQQAARDAGGQYQDDGVDFMGGDAPMPLDTQFYHDGDDDGAFELATQQHSSQQVDANSAAEVDVADYEEEDLAQQAAALKRVKPEYVNYAKKAKRVDVRKLKENIWKELGIGGILADETAAATVAAMDSSLDSEDGPPSTPPRPSTDGTLVTSSNDPTSTRTFRSILGGLRKAYPKEKMDEISTSFCFICLLHLANEEGLEIQLGGAAPKKQPKALTAAGAGGLGAFLTPGRRLVVDDDDDEDEEEDEEEDEDDKTFKVGRLETLQIKKDPKAGRSA